MGVRLPAEYQGEFLVGPDVIDSISPLMVAWRRIMIAAASVVKKLTKLIATSTTGLVSFDTNVEMPTKVTCEFSPVQEGSGDPSPVNVRPISGWTRCEIPHTGKNLLRATDVYDDETTKTSGNVRMFKLVVPNGTYTISTNAEYVDNLACIFVGSSDSYGRSMSTSGNGINPSNPRTLTITNGIIVIGVRKDLNAGGKIVTRQELKNEAVTIQVEYGSTATAYESYQGEIIPINWQSEAGTVYGGTVTLNEDGSVDVIGTCEIYTVNRNNVQVASYSYTNVKYAEFQKPANSALNGINNATKICVCSIGTIYRIAGGFDNSARINQLVISAVGDYLWFGFAPETTLEEMQETLDGTVICHELKPEYCQTYHFDNIGQLQSYLGTNNVWHDMNGSITAEYWNKQ